MKLTCEHGAYSRFWKVFSKRFSRMHGSGFSRRQLIKTLDELFMEATAVSPPRPTCFA